SQAPSQNRRRSAVIGKSEQFFKNIRKVKCGIVLRSSLDGQDAMEAADFGGPWVIIRRGLAPGRKLRAGHVALSKFGCCLLQWLESSRLAVPREGLSKEDFT